MKDPRTNTVGLMHITGFSDTEADINDMISGMVQCASLSLSSTSSSGKDDNDNSFVCDTLEMYLFGGFLDEKGYSEPISTQVFDIARKSTSYDIHLKLACCCSVNDTMNFVNNHYQHEPIATGVGVHLADGANLEIRIVTCVNQGPDMLLRKARLSHIIDCSNNGSDPDKKTPCFNMFHYETGCVFIDPFKFAKPRYSTELLQLPDATYLKYYSTSPHCEPPHFVKLSKDTIRFALKYHREIDDIFKGKTRKWKLNTESSQWCLQDDDHEELHL